jgi:hypothetical protein
LSNTPFTTLKMTVFAPTAIARVIRAIAEKSGARLSRRRTRLVRPKNVNMIKNLPGQPSSTGTAASQLFGFPLQQTASEYAKQFAGHTEVFINQQNRKLAGSSSVRPRTVLFKSERLPGLVGTW